MNGLERAESRRMALILGNQCCWDYTDLYPMTYAKHGAHTSTE